MSCAALLAAVSLVGACSSTPEPTPSSTTPVVTTPAPSTTAPSPTVTTPSPSASGIPAAAKVKSEAGAIAFVKYFLDVNNAAYTTPDPDLLREVSDSNCKICGKLIEDVETLMSKGRKYNGPVVSFQKAEVIGENGPGRVLLACDITQNRSSVVDSSGKVILTDPEKQLQRTFELVWKGGQWLVSELG